MLLAQPLTVSEAYNTGIYAYLYPALIFFPAMIIFALVTCPLAVDEAFKTEFHDNCCVDYG